MKKICLLVVLFLSTCTFVKAQMGYINVIAGSGDGGFNGDNGPAISAAMGEMLDVAADPFGNVYIPDIENERIRKISPLGIITTIAGGGSSTADGIPATSASISLSAGGIIATDVYGNIYFGNDVSIHKITVTTGIITTIAGTGTEGYSGDGGPATAAQVGGVGGMCFDNSGNMYFGDSHNNCIRKINTSGIISTYAGNGTSGYSGDGGSALSAQLNTPDGVCIDPQGNLFVADRYNNVIRKINTSGVISTFASSNFFEPSDVCADAFGNIYVADFHNGRVCIVSPIGTVSNFAGGGSSSGSGIPATSESFGDIWGISIDQASNIYVADRSGHRIWKVNGVGLPTASTDSFSVFVNSLCNGPSITVLPAHNNPSLQLKTFFGDGSTQVDSLCSLTDITLTINHNYSTSGIFTIKHVLYNGSNAIDSVAYSYSYILCTTMAMQFYYDENANCLKDGSEVLLSQPMLVEIDSNDIPVDTISSTSGFYYTVYGSAGDIYSFKVIAAPAGFNVTCPSGGVIYDTIGSVSGGATTKYIGLQCASGNSFDLSVNATVPVTGVNDQWGNIYVQNAYCAPENATLTLHYSSVYPGIPDQLDNGAVIGADHTITWNLSALSSTLSGPTMLHYSVWIGGTQATIGDTTHSYFVIDPNNGDNDTTNNHVIVVDTVRAGCDPNEMWVTPTCMASGATANLLRYTINFENTGNDTAHNIYVLDTLPGNVDASTVRIEMASHQMYTSKYTDGAGHTIMKFDFPAINLLDSSHHGKCDGAIIFNIKSKPGLASGADVANRAGIYFDVNPVVMTNQVDTKVGGCTATSVAQIANTHKVSLYPNPATTELTITMERDAYHSLTITNSIGQEVLSQVVSNVSTKVNIATLPAGIYYVEVKGDGGSKVMKFMKM